MRTPRTPYPLFAAVLLWALSALAAAPYTGTWMATPLEDKLMMNFRFKEHGQMGLTLPRSAFQGLNTADGADTKFQLAREAGTLSFEGRFSGGEGAGHYQFQPHAAYLQEMAKLGYAKISPDEQLQLALFDVGPARVKALAELGYTKIPHDELLQVAIFQVTPEHIRELAELGFRKLDFEDLLATRIHGVNSKYIQEIREAGYPNVTLEQLVEMRIHAIDGNYIRSLSRNKEGGRK
ncbi:hypothetical protein [Archangium sp.]|uniref:hypothetical protein n=1 Tax=Archangium sp. TaxID=1872627 RepID=UPI002D745922|nr:hypothetical protein [Archangium sp.]HYO51698.1 hypothetical protein [Archangium sp.]